MLYANTICLNFSKLSKQTNNYIYCTNMWCKIHCLPIRRLIHSSSLKRAEYAKKFKLYWKIQFQNMWMLLYMINDPEETSISKQTFVNPTAFHTLNHTDYIRREREGRMEAVRGDWLHLLLLLTLACLVIVIVRLVVGLYHRRILFRGFPEPIEERHWLFGHLLVVSILCTRHDINLNVCFVFAD